MKNRSETSTFAGVPIPLTMETLLDAMVMADRRRIVPSYLQGTFPNAQRQYHAFRSRILRMDAEKNILLAQWESMDEINRERSQQRLQRIAQLEADNIDLSEEYAKACKRIAEIEEQLTIEKEFGMHYHAEFMKLFERKI